MLNKSPASGGLANRAMSRAWGNCSDRIANDPDLDAATLVLTAYRLTLINWGGLHDKDAQRIVACGLSKRPFQRALRKMQQKGLLARDSYILRGHGRGRSFARDQLTPLCAAAATGYRRVERRWFGRTLSVKALALLLYARAMGRHRVTPRQVHRRFGWSAQTIRRAAHDLIDAGCFIRSAGSTTRVCACKERAPVVIRGREN